MAYLVLVSQLFFKKKSYQTYSKYFINILYSPKNQINNMIKISEISQLIAFLSPNKLKQIAFIDYKNIEESTKIDQLYKRLKEGEKDEKKLMNLLFDQGKYQKSNYNRLKRQLEERLINTLFLIDANKNKYQEMRQAYYACYKNVAAVKILLGKNARNLAISLAEKTYKTAERFEFIDILLNLSKDLRNHYGSIIGDKRMFTFYNKKTQSYTDAFLAELKAEEYFAELALNFSISRVINLEHRKKIIAHSEELEQIINQYSSYRFKLCSYIVIAVRYEATNDYENSIKICDQALLFFKIRKHFASKAALYIFYFRKIASLILLKKLNKAEETTLLCLKLESPGLYNWYQTMGYRFIIFLHLESFSKAIEVYFEAIEHPNFSKQYPSVKEVWHINEAFVYYFHLQGAIKEAPNERIEKFRINRFLNEVPSYSKDKQGLNISILILQVLFLLHQKQYGKIIDRTEALRTYTHRYLRRDETFRSNCFIKMLMQLPKANFHRAAVERKTKELREKLSSVGIIQNQSAEVEIVPYEVLWEFVLESLDNKIH